MIKLPQIVDVKGTGIRNLTFSLVERTDKKAIYMRSDNVYEVFYVKISRERFVFGNDYPEKEAYPGNEDFGKTAWCFN
jgi:hypothetical protein